MVTGHEKGREMTEKEALEKREEEKRRELEVLRGAVMEKSGGMNGNASQTLPGPVGYQLKTTPHYTSSTIPGLGSLPPQSSNENEMNRLRRENASLKFQMKDLKMMVLPRVDALTEDLRSLNSKTAEHEMLVQNLVSERDQLRGEVDGFRGGEEAGDGHQEIDLDMDFA